MRQKGYLRAALLLTVLAALLLGATGCGYLRNVRDDLLDCGTLAVGTIPPIVPTEEGTMAVGFLPPTIGVYAQFTELFHLGGLFKATGDLEWDRRGYGIMLDTRAKVGLGPFHWVWITQEPLIANAYKIEGSEMEGWREHMAQLKDPVFKASAKTMIFEPHETVIPGLKRLPYLSHGWQDWEFVSLEVGLPEPFLLHTGFYFRGGVDASQVFDLLLGLIGVDYYDDAAYTFWGDLKY